MRATAMLKSGERLYLGVTPTTIPAGDTYAAYEGRMGGMVWVCSETDGSKLAEIALESPAVWDGMAAADGRLLLSTVDGSVLCLAGSQKQGRHRK